VNEISDEPESVDAGQQFAVAGAVAELLECSAPHQRALLSVLAVADRHDIDPIPLISSLAEELPAADKVRAEELAEQITEGVEAVDALDQIPYLLPPTCVLALRLARDQGTLSELYVGLLDRYRGSEPDPSSYEVEYVPALARMAGRVLAVAVLVSFIMLKIVPEFQKMLEEFQVEPPPAFYLLMSVCDRIVKFWFLPFLLMVCLMVCCIPMCRRYLGRLSPLKWRQRTFSSAVNRRRSLALVTQMASSVRSGVTMILNSASLDRIFPRLLEANEKIENGEDEWESLAAEHVISKRESNALALTVSGDTQAWLLRWSATDQQQRRATRGTLLMRIALVTMNVAIALIVALTCFAIFTTYLEIVTAMQGNQ
jgi:type II secretory pathway component PulF